MTRLDWIKRTADAGGIALLSAEDRVELAAALATEGMTENEFGSLVLDEIEQRIEAEDDLPKCTARNVNLSDGTDHVCTKPEGHEAAGDCKHTGANGYWWEVYPRHDGSSLIAKPQAAATWDLVIADMKARDDLGAKKYGERHRADIARDHLKDAYEEALDLACYLRAELQRRDGK